jgi:hypothetical protein
MLAPGAVAEARRPAAPARTAWAVEPTRLTPIAIAAELPAGHPQPHPLRDRFGGGAIAGLFVVGPYPQLLGAAVADLRGGSRPGGVALEAAGELQRVEPAAGYLPAYVRGRIVGAPRGLDLAIAVNGRVRALTRTAPAGAAVRFDALVPEESFRPGHNTVEVLAIAATPRGPRLLRFGAEAATPRRPQRRPGRPPG